MLTSNREMYGRDRSCFPPSLYQPSNVASHETLNSWDLASARTQKSSLGIPLNRPSPSADAPACLWQRDPVCLPGHAAVAGMEQARARLGIEFNDRRLPMTAYAGIPGQPWKYHDCRQKLRQLCFRLNLFTEFLLLNPRTVTSRPLQSHPVFFVFHMEPSGLPFLRRNSSFP